LRVELRKLQKKFETDLEALEARLEQETKAKNATDKARKKAEKDMRALKMKFEAGTAEIENFSSAEVKRLEGENRELRDQLEELQSGKIAWDRQKKKLEEQRDDAQTQQKTLQARVEQLSMQYQAEVAKSAQLKLLIQNAVDDK